MFFSIYYFFQKKVPAKNHLYCRYTTGMIKNIGCDDDLFSYLLKSTCGSSFLLQVHGTLMINCFLLQLVYRKFFFSPSKLIANF